MGRRSTGASVFDRRALGCSLAAAAFVAGRDAAADTREACAIAAERGQSLRDQGKLLESQDAFRTCADAACPAIVRQDCITWLDSVRGLTPTFIVRARDGDRDLSAVRVYVDGAL